MAAPLNLVLFPSLSYRNDFPHEKVPTLREAVAESLNHNLIIFFDVKGHANKVHRLIAQASLLKTDPFNR